MFLSEVHCGAVGRAFTWWYILGDKWSKRTWSSLWFSKFQSQQASFLSLLQRPWTMRRMRAASWRNTKAKLRRSCDRQAPRLRLHAPSRQALIHSSEMHQHVANMNWQGLQLCHYRCSWDLRVQDLLPYVSWKRLPAQTCVRLSRWFAERVHPTAWPTNWQCGEAVQVHHIR